MNSEKLLLMNKMEEYTKTITGVKDQNLRCKEYSNALEATVEKRKEAFSKLNDQVEIQQNEYSQLLVKLQSEQRELKDAKESLEWLRGESNVCIYMLLLNFVMHNFRN